MSDADRLRAQKATSTDPAWLEREAKRAPLNAGNWKDREEFEIWWSESVTAFNRLSVDAPDKWERIAKLIEKFQKDNPQ